MHLRALRLSNRNLHIQRPHLIPGIWQADWAPTGRVTSWWLQISSVSSLLGRKLSEQTSLECLGHSGSYFPFGGGRMVGAVSGGHHPFPHPTGHSKSDIASPRSPTLRGLKPGKQKTPNAIFSEVPLKTYFKFCYVLTLNVRPIFSVFKNCTKQDFWLWVDRWAARVLEHSHHASFNFMFGWPPCILEVLLPSGCQGSDFSLHLATFQCAPKNPCIENLIPVWGWKPSRKTPNIIDLPTALFPVLSQNLKKAEHACSALIPHLCS